MSEDTLMTYLYHKGINGVYYQLARDIASGNQESVVVIFDEEISELFRKGIKLHSQDIPGILFAVMYNISIEKIIQHGENEIHTDADSCYDLYRYIDREVVFLEHYDYTDINDRTYKIMHNTLLNDGTKAGIYRMR